MPRVTKPANQGSQSKNDKTFVWNMEGYYHTSSAVIVGSAPGIANYYPGVEKASGTYQDANVNHPGGNLTCYTRPKYKKGGAAWYTDGSIITSFTSQP